MLNFLRKRIHRQYYDHIHIEDGSIHQPKWQGVPVCKYPQDLILYSEVLFERRPDYLIETGTFCGGSALFFAAVMSLYGGKGIVTIDAVRSSIFDKPGYPQHGLITFCIGNSIDPQFAVDMKRHVGDGSVMVVLDSRHDYHHVSCELALLADLVTPGQFLVVEDCWHRGEKSDPYYAVEDFLKTHLDFARMSIADKYIFSNTQDGWLLKGGKP